MQLEGISFQPEFERAYVQRPHRPCSLVSMVLSVLSVSCLYFHQTRAYAGEPKVWTTTATVPPAADLSAFPSDLVAKVITKLTVQQYQRIAEAYSEITPAVERHVQSTYMVLLEPFLYYTGQTDLSADVRASLAEIFGSEIRDVVRGKFQEIVSDIIRESPFTLTELHEVALDPKAAVTQSEAHKKIFAHIDSTLDQRKAQISRELVEVGKKFVTIEMFDRIDAKIKELTAKSESGSSSHSEF